MNIPDLPPIAVQPFDTGALRTIVLGMGCFWSPEALFGGLPGVAGTRTGYAGGTTPAPVYRALGDHSETVEVRYDPAAVALETILETFWNGHRPASLNDYQGRQYQSLVLYRGEAELDAVRAVQHRLEPERGTLATELAPLGDFYEAEERHRKYYLKRHPDAMAKLAALYPAPEQLEASTVAARLNALAKGFVNLAHIERDIGGWPLTDVERTALLRLIRLIRW